MKIVAVSGFFTVLHKGHIELFEEAKRLGDYLIVIVNNNAQQIKKKGELIHSCEDIKYMIERLGMVNECVISLDKDKTVCQTLDKLRPDIFANGGDRVADNIPEYKICDLLKIQMVFGVGGDKINSSSEILAKGGK